MAFVLGDRVKQTTTTTGTGSYTLDTPSPIGYQDFSTGVGNGNTTFYVAVAGNEWEVGVGTVTTGSDIVLSRSVIKSTNSNSAVVWGAGTKEVFCVLPADAANMLRLSGSNQSIVITAGSDTITLDPNGGSTIEGGLTVDGGLEADAITVGSVDVVTETRTITSGDGLTGGGDLSTNRTLAVGAGTGISVGADTVGLDTSNTRNVDHSGVSVSAGNGLTGGGAITSTVTLNVGAGDGIDVDSDSVSVDETVVRTTGNFTIEGEIEFDEVPTINGDDIATINDIAAASTVGGYISSDALSNVLPAGWSASRTNTGRYTITMPDFGGTNYAVVVTLANLSNPGRIQTSVNNLTNTSFDVVWYSQTDSQFANVPFRFIFVGIV